MKILLLCQSVMKTMILLLSFLFLPSAYAENSDEEFRKNAFVDLHEISPGIAYEIRYFGNHNFIGRPIEGYKAPKCFLTLQAAQELAKVQKELEAFSLRLKVYDCYRPQRAVDDFVDWAKNLRDKKMKKEFYPSVKKKHLFRDGYIASQSGHSRGSTIDLTIENLDMGTPYDYFDPVSHTANPKIGEKAHANRLLLKTLMEKHGFVNYDKEWWHYTLKNEPFSDRYFDFEVQ